MDKFNLISDGILLLLILYLTFFKSYFKEKGKNFATKEDIGKITNIIEGIKHDFDTDTERIRQQLIFLNQKKISIITEERDSIIGYYQSYFKYLNQILRFSTDNISEADPLEYIKTNNLISSNEMDFYCSEGRLDLFLNNSEFIDAHGELSIKTIELRTLLSQYLIQYKSITERIVLLKSDFSETSHQEVLDLIDKRLELSTTYYDDRTESYRTLYPELLKVRRILKRRLVELLTE